MRDTRCEREKIQSQRHLHHSLIMMMIQRFALLARFGSSSLFLRQRNRNRTRAKWCIFFSNVWHKIVRYFDRNDPLRLFVNSSSKVGWLSWQTSHCTFEECISCESIWRCFSGWLADSVMFHAYYPIANYLRTTMRIGKVVKSDRHLRVRAPNNLGHMSCGSGTDVILYSSCTRLVTSCPTSALDLPSKSPEMKTRVYDVGLMFWDAVSKQVSFHHHQKRREKWRHPS